MGSVPLMPMPTRHCRHQPTTMPRHFQDYHDFRIIPSVKATNDRSWFQRHLGLPDLIARYQYLCSELHRYNVGPRCIAFTGEIARIHDGLRKLEIAAYQLDFRRIHSSVPYDYEVQALRLASHTITNQILAMHEQMFREQQKLSNDERKASAGLYSSSSESGNKL